jgi:peptide/nickel transport system permease protein
MSEQGVEVKVPTSPRKVAVALPEEESIYRLTQWQLMLRKFRQHKVAVVGGYVLAFVYLTAIFAQFLSPYPIEHREERAYQPPQTLHFRDASGVQLRPFVYGMTMTRDPQSLESIYVDDPAQEYPFRFFVRSWEYKLWGLIPTDLHLFGTDEGGYVFLLGTDDLGRDMLSRILHGAQISLSVGLMGIALSFVIGLTLGGISGYFGGTLDVLIQRVIEFLRGIPTLPLWMALSAAVPPNWPPIRVYFGVTLVLATIGWTGLARVVRGKLLQLRAEDYVMAAEFLGASESRIIARHMLPGMASYLIVRLTLAVPGMILGETALSFLGLGLRPPVVSWGVLLQKAQNVQTMYLHPWTLAPAVAVIMVVLAFNTFGDGLRDAADPYKR